MFKYINARGEVLPLSNNENFDLIEIDGLTAATASLSALTIGGVDGDIVNNSQAQPRTLILTLKMKESADVEKAKMSITQIVKLKQTGSIEWQQNERTFVISGVVEAIEMPRWENGVAMQITLHCEQPFWEDLNAVTEEISEEVALHYFTNLANDMLYFPEEGIPFGEYDYSRTRTLINAGDVSVGLEIEINAVETVTNPIIYGANGEFFGIGYGTGAKKVVLNAGDILRINTTRGKKSVKLNGTTSLLNKIKPSSTWLQLAAGSNDFSINSDDSSTENMTFSFSYKQRYV